MIAEVLALRGARYATGRLAPPGSLEGPLLERLRDYKLRVAKRYRAVSPASAETYLPAGRLFVSPKIDGELWFAVRSDGRTALVAPNGRVLAGVPLTDALETCLGTTREAIVAGELFVAATDPGQRPRVFHVARALRDPDQAARLGFKAFDLVALDGEDAQAWPYQQRLDALTRLFPETGPASRVRTWVEDKRAALEHYREWVEQGKRYEGLVARHEGGVVYKVKPEIGLDVVVVAWSDRLVHDRSELRELHVAVMRDDGRFHVLGSVGTGLSDELRLSLHDRLTQMAAESSYRMANREGMLCRFVRPELVIEVRCTDLLGPDPGEPPNLRMTLAWDPKTGWSAAEALPTVSLIHPVFVRERTDKIVDRADVGLEQILQVVPAEGEVRAPSPMRTPIAAPLTRDAEPSFGLGPHPAGAPGLPAATVLARKVWTKVSKGKTSVRKYVAWATNKSEIDPRHPRYVVAFTDFSPGRKEPLQRDLRVASSRERLEWHMQLWERENIKKGWNPA